MLLFLNPAQTRSTSNAASQIFITMGSVEFLPPLAAMRIDIVEDARTDPPPPLPPSKRQNRWFLGEIAIDTRHSTSTAWPLPGRHPRTSTTVFVCAHLRPSSNFTTTSSRQTITSPPSHTSAAAAAEQTQPDSTPPRCRAEHTHPPASSQPTTSLAGDGGGLYPPSDGSQTAVRGRHRGLDANRRETQHQSMIRERGVRTAHQE